MDFQHSEVVRRLAQQIQKLHGQFRVYHGSTNSTRFSGRQRGSIVDIRGLNRVLHIDVEREVAVVQSSCPLDKLVKATLPFGLIPPVVPEFPGITVGGAYAGTAGESSSFKHGLFNATVEKIEIILANGDVVNASREENHDLFTGAAGTLGTLGIITLLEIKLQKAKKYVRIRFKPVRSSREAMSCIETAVRDSRNDFIEGIMFNATSGVVMIGEMTDDTGEQVVRFTRPWDPWFYLYALSKIRSCDGETEGYTPLVDYLFRYDRGCFWTGKLAFEYFLTPFNRFTRFILDYFMHARVAYRAVHASGLSRQYIVQDVAFPSNQVEDFLAFVDKELGIRPIWICPLTIGRIGLMPRHVFDAQMLYNIGVWGRGSKDFSKFVAINRDIEMRAKDMGGVKWLYAQVFYSEEEFWDIYSREEYDKVRIKYKADKPLPTVFEKMGQDMNRLRESLTGEFWPMRGLWGVWKTIIGSETILFK